MQEGEKIKFNAEYGHTNTLNGVKNTEKGFDQRPLCTAACFKLPQHVSADVWEKQEVMW